MGDSQTPTSESGFTLIELLVVLLIIGILASIAVPMFIADRLAGGDGAAKELMHTAADSASIYSIDNGLTGYTGMTPAALKQKVPAINTAANGQAVLVNAAPTASGYILTVVSSTADTFNLTNTNGTVTRTCLVASGNGNTSTNTGGGCNNGGW